MSNNEMTLKDKSLYENTGFSDRDASGHAFSDPYICSTDIPDRVCSCPRSAVSEAVDLFASLYIRECIPDAGAY